MLQPRELGIHRAVVRQLCNQRGKRANCLAESAGDVVAMLSMAGAWGSGLVRGYGVVGGL